MMLDHRLRDLAMIELVPMRDCSAARQKAVLLIIAAFEDEPMRFEFIARKSGMSDETVRHAMRHLAGAGLVERVGVRERGRPGIYRVSWGRVGTLAARDAQTPMHRSRECRSFDEVRCIAHACGALRLARETDPSSRAPGSAGRRREVIRRLRDEGLRLTEIAEALGWSRKLVWHHCRAMGDKGRKGTPIMPGCAA